MATLSGLRKAQQAGESSETQVHAALEAIRTDNGRINAFLSTLDEQAIEKARKLDTERAQGKVRSPLHGLPIAVKDNLCLTGARTTCGSKILENFVAPYTATALERLEQAGAVIIGKTNLDEFAMGSSNESSHFGPVLNPRHPEYIPGGSSGGSAAAVAAGLVPAALGSDTGGSIRQPAACCGIVGFKPTYGRVSRYGLVAYASSLDQIGPLGNSVLDCAELLQAIAGVDARDNTTSPMAVDDYSADLETSVRGKVIGIPRECFGEGLDSECRTVLENSLAALEKEGAVLREISLPTLSYAISAYYVIATAEASSNLSRFDGVRYTHRSAEAHNLNELFTRSRSEGFGDEVQRRILLGTFVLSSGFYDAYYVKAQKVRRRIADDFGNALAECDAIASPTLPGRPMKVGEGLSDPMAMYLSDIYTVSLNLAGLPGISLPCGTLSDGIPVGMQLIGKAFGERQLLSIAANVERLAGR